MDGRMRQWMAMCVLAVTGMLCLPARGEPAPGGRGGPTVGPASAQSESAARPLPRPRGLEAQPVRRNAGGGWRDWLWTLAALVVVAGLIFLLGFILRAVKGVPAAGPAKAMEVFARVPVAPRQQVLLVRLGRRVLVLASGPNGLTALSEIADPAEVAELVASAGGGKGGSFAGLLRRNLDRFNQAGGAGAQEQDPADQAARDLARKLRSRLPDSEERP